LGHGLRGGAAVPGRRCPRRGHHAGSGGDRDDRGAGAGAAAPAHPLLPSAPAHRGLGPLGIAISTAVVLCGTALYAADARYREALGRGLIEPAYEVGGGHNVVNVTLVDARVWDTLGEISVLLVVATGVASLIFVTRREQSISRVRDLDEGVSIWHRRPDTDLPKNVLDFDA